MFNYVFHCCKIFSFCPYLLPLGTMKFKFKWNCCHANNFEYTLFSAIFDFKVTFANIIVDK